MHEDARCLRTAKSMHAELLSQTQRRSRVYDRIMKGTDDLAGPIMDGRMKRRVTKHKNGRWQCVTSSWPEYIMPWTLAVVHQGKLSITRCQGCDGIST